MHTKQRAGNDPVKGSSKRWCSQRVTGVDGSTQILLYTQREEKERDDHGDADTGKAHIHIHSHTSRERQTDTQRQIQIWGKHAEADIENKEVGENPTQ